MSRTAIAVTLATLAAIAGTAVWVCDGMGCCWDEEGDW